MYVITLILLGIVALIIFFFLINLKWCVETIRDISSPKNQGGYTKLIQIGIIILLSSLFVLISLYYALNDGKVDKIDLVFTVVVGWLGLVIGRFFGERAMETLEGERKNYAEKTKLVLKKCEELINQIFPELKKK